MRHGPRDAKVVVVGARWSGLCRSRAKNWLISMVFQNFRGADFPAFSAPTRGGYRFLLCTGTHRAGEPRLALVASFANDDIRSVTTQQGRLREFFPPRTIPGNEKAVGEIINWPDKEGRSRSINDRHTSLKAPAIRSWDELRDMISRGASAA